MYRGPQFMIYGPDERHEFKNTDNKISLSFLMINHFVRIFYCAEKERGGNRG